MRRFALFAVVAVVAAIVLANVVAQDRKKKTESRAEPPKFSDSDTASIFYKDVFNEGLVGARPSNLGAPAATGGNPGGGTDSGTPAGTNGGGGLFAWSKIIAPGAIEDEVGSIKIIVDKQITTPGKFQSTGYRIARKNFSLLAMLFAIAAEYDGDVKWKENSPGLREAFALAASNAKSGSQQVYDQAIARKGDLEVIVNGGNVPIDGSPERKADWSTTCDRSPLMQRLETAQAKLQQMTASASEFKDNKDAALHEAYIVAAISEVLTKEGMLDAEDGEYAAFAKEMLKAAREIVDAAGSDNQPNASKATGAIGQQCAACHETYRA